MSYFCSYDFDYDLPATAKRIAEAELDDAPIEGTYVLFDTGKKCRCDAQANVLEYVKDMCRDFGHAETQFIFLHNERELLIGLILDPFTDSACTEVSIAWRKVWIRKSSAQTRCAKARGNYYHVAAIARDIDAGMPRRIQNTKTQSVLSVRYDLNQGKTDRCAVNRALEYYRSIYPYAQEII